MARKSTPSSRTIALDGDLDLFSIHGQWEQVLPLLGTAGGTVDIDLTGIGDLDLSGVQLLCALDRDLRAKQGSLVLIGAKAEWAPRFASLGLSSLFAGTKP